MNRMTTIITPEIRLDVLKIIPNPTIMKKLFIILLAFSGIASMSFGQSAKNLKAGNVFSIDVPEYMSRTVGLNSAATLQFKNEVKDVYGFIIEDSKEELALAEKNFKNAGEFYEYFIKDFLVGEEKREIGKETTKSKNSLHYVESEASYYDSEYDIEIYYYLGIIETKNNFYKLICYTSRANKDQYKDDFRKILYSLRD